MSKQAFPGGGLVRGLLGAGAGAEAGAAGAAGAAGRKFVESTVLGSKPLEEAAGRTLSGDLKTVLGSKPLEEAAGRTLSGDLKWLWGAIRGHPWRTAAAVGVPTVGGSALAGWRADVNNANAAQSQVSQGAPPAQPGMLAGLPPWAQWALMLGVPTMGGLGIYTALQGLQKDED